MYTELSLLLLPCLDLKSVHIYIYILYTCTHLKWPKADIHVITVAK